MTASPNARLLIAALALLVALAGCSGEGGSRFADRIAEADSVFSNRQYAQAGELFELIANDAEAAGDDSAFAEAASMRARALLQTGDRETGREWLERAAAVASTEDPPGWSRYLAVRGRFEWTNKEQETATETFKELYDYCEANELYERAVDATHMIAIVAPSEERFEWSRKGIAMAEAGELTGWLGPLWNNMGWDYVDAGEYDRGLEALERAREYHYKSGEDLPRLIADYSVAHVKRLRGDLDVAEEEMQATLDLATRMRDEGHGDALEWMGFSRWDLGEIAVAEGDAARGLELMRTALKELEQAGMRRWDPDGWQEKQWRITEVSEG